MRPARVGRLRLRGFPATQGTPYGCRIGPVTRDSVVMMPVPSPLEFMGATAAVGHGMSPGPQHHRASIVVGLDGREHDADALALTQAIRHAFVGQITLVHVVPETPPLGRGMVEFQTAERREGQELLARAAAALGEPVETELLSPWPAALALERLAFKRHASLLVLGSSHRKAIGRIVPGAVALRLLKGAPCPVAVAPSGYAEGSPDEITSVGVAYDATSGSDRALQAAAAAAARLKAPLYVYHAIPYDRLDELSRAQMLNFGRVILDRAREQLPPWVSPRERELVGVPATAIVDAVKDDRIGLLFAGSRGHGPLREGLFGGVCRALLQSAPCPIVLTPREAALWTEEPRTDEPDPA